MAGSSGSKKRTRGEKVFIFVGILVAASMILAPLISLLLVRQ